MKHFSIIILTFLIFFLKPAFALEAETINISVMEIRNIELRNVEKFLIVQQEFLDARLESGILSIKGLKTGQTTLHIWKNGELFSYIIKVGPPNIEKKKTFEHKIYNTSNQKLDYGFFNLNASSSFNNINTVQSLSNNFYYRFPLLEGNIHLKANVLSGFSGFKSFNNLFIDNISAKYSNRNFFLELGDISTHFNGLLPIYGNIRGINLSLYNKTNDLTFFSGFERPHLVLYNNNKIYGDYYNRLKTGISGKYTLNDILSFNSGFFSDLDFTNPLKNNNVLNAGFKFNYPGIFNMENELATNFSGLAGSSNVNFRHKWDGREEEIGININYSNLSREFLKTTYNYFRESLSTSVNLKHISGISLSGSFSTNVSDNFLNRLATFKISKNINNNIGLFFNYRFNSLDNINRYFSTNNFELGLNNNFFIPFYLSYFIITGESTAPFYSNNIRLNLPVFRNEYGSLNLANLTSINNSLNNLEIDRRLTSNISLDYKLNLIKNLLIGGYIYYNILVNDYQLANNFNDRLSLNINSAYQLPQQDRIYFSSSFSFNDFSQNPLINTHLGYIHNFGEAARSTDIGEIKGIIFEDSNDNQIFDPDEKIVPGISLYTNDKRIYSDNSGFYFKDLDYGSYNIIIDKNSLPDGYRITTQLSEKVNLYSKVKEVNFGISSNLPIFGKIYGNKYKSTGLEKIKVILDNNESTFTDSKGNFKFLTKEGKHTVKLDNGSIPANYILQGKDISQDFNLTNKDEPFIEFTFNPIRTLKGTVFYASHPGQIKPNGSKRLTNTEITIKYFYEDGEKEEKIITNEKGEFYLDNLEEGQIEISSLLLKQPIKVEIPDSPVDLNIPIAIYDEKLNLRNKKVRTSSRMSPIK